jgi:hypothetical protein
LAEEATIAGQKIGIEKPRVRSTKANREVPLEVYGLGVCAAEKAGKVW